MKKKYLSLGTLAMVAIMALTSTLTVFADTNSNRPMQGQNEQDRGGKGLKGIMSKKQIHKPAVVGVVSAISGTTITVTSKRGSENTSENSSSQITFTINASNAQIFKANATSTLSNISVGDNIIAEGTVSGTNVTATVIRDGQIMNQKKNYDGENSAIPNFQGNGQPVIAGTISTINGNILTITNKSNVSYSVDATNAKIYLGNATSSLLSLSNGDQVIVQGTVSGTSIVASSIFDQKKSADQNEKSTTTPSKQNRGFFGSIGNFFAHLFGF